MRKTALLPAAIASALLFPALANAYEASTLIGRVGVVMVEPDESSSDVDVRTGNIGKVPDARVGVDNDTQLGLTLTYMVADHIGIGVLGATPFEHDIVGTGALAGIGKLGSTRHLPPTLSLEYFPLDASSPIQPYVGVGLNYTTFFSEKTTDNLTAVFQLVADANLGAGAVTVRDVDMKLKDSFGLAAELGVDVKLTDNLLLNAAVWMVDIDTEAKLKGRTQEGVDIHAKVDVDIDPTVYMLSLGYRF